MPILTATAITATEAARAAAPPSIEHDGTGLVLRKRAVDEDARARLRHEHDVLDRIDLPGVVRVRHLHDDGREATLTLAYVGARSVATLRRPPLDQVVTVVGTVAETVADLHARGLVHHAVRPEHVVLDAHDRPVLVGFGSATTTPPGHHDHLGRAADVQGLGLLLGALLDRSAEAGGRRDRRGPRRSRRVEARVRHELEGVAAQATADDPARRPTARQLAIAVARAGAADARDTRRDRARGRARPPRAARHGLPDDRTARSRRRSDAERDDHPSAVPAPVAPRPEPTTAPTAPATAGGRRPRARRGLGLAIGLTAVVALGIGGLSLAHGPRPAIDASSAAHAVPARVEAPATAPTDDLPAAPTPSTSATVPSSHRSRQIQPAGFVTVDHRRYAIGEPGDEVAVMDPACDGAVTVVLLRPSTGDVFAFDGWAEPTHDRFGSRATVLPAATHLVADQPGGADDACAPLRAVLPDGAVVAVPIPAPTPAPPGGSTP